MGMSKAVKVDKDYVEKVVIEDLRKKYPDIIGYEFTSVKQFYKWWIVVGVFSTQRKFSRIFEYTIDGETGKIIEYYIYPLVI
jgi:hypothetical protein